ncbi:MAG: hypothetical protein IK130_10435 [Oscillospiraceae bacterium]|nr:hypothetical protein [Oscillospiraceae bacterium]
MTERFENLDAAALHLADDTLSHIAETASLPQEAADRIAAKTMEKAGFAQAEKKPAIRHRKRPKRLAALIAAAVSVAALTIGVGGYLRYNKRAMEKNFGVLGTATLNDLHLAEPQTFTNGTVNATVEAVLCDGSHAFVLTTFKAADPAQEVDWERDLYYFYEKGHPDCSYATAFPDDCMIQKYDDEAWVTWGIELPEESAGDTLTLCFAKHETDFPTKEIINEVKRAGGNVNDLYSDPQFVGCDFPYYDELTDGLEIDIPLAVNVPVITLRSDYGAEIRMSGFEMVSTKGAIDAGNGGDMTITRQDGTTAEGWIKLAFDETARYIEKIDGVSYRYNKPESYIGFTDVSDIASVEFGGVVYTRTE